MIDAQGGITENFLPGDYERLNNITDGFLNETGIDFQDIQAAADYANQTISEVFTPTTESIANSTNPTSFLVKPQISWSCTYRCSVYNTCMVKGAWAGDTSNCGSEPADCQCVWGIL